MNPAPRDAILIPYATARLSTRLLGSQQPGADGVPWSCRVPHVVVEPARARALRLSDARYEFSTRASSAYAGLASDPLALLRARIEDLTDMWSRPSRAFLSCYFALVAARVERNRSELEERLRVFGGLYTYRDWIYAALAPFPRAWLYAPARRSGAASYRDFVAVDFAFWTGRTLVAVQLGGFETPTVARLAQLERLAHAGVRVCPVPVAALDDSDGDTLAEHLPDAFLRFWRGRRFPSGPFSYSMLGDLEDIGPPTR